MVEPGSALWVVEFQSVAVLFSSLSEKINVTRGALSDMGALHGAPPGAHAATVASAGAAPDAPGKMKATESFVCIAGATKEQDGAQNWSCTPGAPRSAPDSQSVAFGHAGGTAKSSSEGAPDFGLGNAVDVVNTHARMKALLQRVSAISG